MNRSHYMLINVTLIKESAVKVLNNNCLLFTLGAETFAKNIPKFLHLGSINLSQWAKKFLFHEQKLSGITIFSFLFAGKPTKKTEI